MSERIHNIDDNTFQTEVLQSNEPVNKTFPPC